MFKKVSSSFLMIASVQLAHLSDLHLTQYVSCGPAFWNLKRLLGYLNWCRKRRFVHSPAFADKIFDDIIKKGISHVALTGDLTNLGLPKEHEEAKIWLEKRDPFVSIALIPGNHDIYSKPEDFFSCLQNWQKYMENDRWGQGFCNNKSSPFPYLRKIGSLVLIGLNSAHPTVPFKADGFLDDAQLFLLEKFLCRLKNEGFLRVVLIHHPPLQEQTASRRALRNANKLQEVLSNHGAELILHGHNHKTSLCWLKPKNGNPIPIIGVGSGSSASLHGTEKLASYHLFDFEIKDKCYEISLTVRGLKSKEGDVVDLSHWKIWPSQSFPSF